MSAVLRMVLDLIKDPQVSNKVILQLAFSQMKAIGYTKVLALLLGALMVSVSSFIKIPQIKKILKPVTYQKRAELAEGLSRDSVRLETLAQFIYVSFNQHEHNPFINYGESFFVGVQNLFILMLLEYYRLRKEIGNVTTLSDESQIKIVLRELIKPAAAILGAVIFITRIAPPSLIQVLQMLIIPIGIAAKVPQIRRNEALKSTAHLSEITVGANVMGSLIRVFTTITNFNKTRRRDSILLAGYSTSLALNAYIAGQIYRYRKTKVE